ncbi:hypothetical protein NWP26_17005 [Chrysosporum ovalisporum APH033B]|uniref:hypothetical protein n=1 Tax=Umezakia ovalisporum TaxID=75695 RepID=UPI002475E917|nr:hypothetical protein [Umezakia ovalisporum]MDH6068891.1 hypothetical protein [Umezakia ovalisporum APH033B]MDH6079594.1 hypothetical protein [Umezakia ovalisporum FSS-45]MDH6101788.1 hypothetical protein [Umezakia ovalisporum ANA283AFssAo]
MFGFIKKLITGILSFITGLLPGIKGNGYYLELNESTDDKVTNGTSNSTKTTASVAVDSPTTAPIPTPVTKVESSQKSQANQAKPATAPAAISNGTKTPPGETTFAPKYLVPSASSSNFRRRPGANMNSYLDMARKMKTSN